MPIVIITNESPGVCTEGSYLKTRMYDTLLSFYTRHQNRIPQTRVNTSLFTAQSSPPDCSSEYSLLKLSAVPINPVTLASMGSSIDNVRLKWKKVYQSWQVKQHLLQRMLEEQDRIICKLTSLKDSVSEEVSKYDARLLVRNQKGDPFQRVGAPGKELVPSPPPFTPLVRVKSNTGVSFPEDDVPVLERLSLPDLGSLLFNSKPFNKGNSFKYKGRHPARTVKKQCSVIHFLDDDPYLQIPINSLWMRWVSLLNLLSCKLEHLFQYTLAQCRPADAIILLIRTTMRRVRFLYEKPPAILSI